VEFTAYKSEMMKNVADEGGGLTVCYTLYKVGDCINYCYITQSDQQVRKSDTSAMRKSFIYFATICCRNSIRTDCYCSTADWLHADWYY